MPAPIKKVYVTCHEPIAVSDTARQGWADVWLRYKTRRRTVYKGPTLISRADLVREISRQYDYATRNQGDSAATYLAYASELESLLSKLNLDGIVCRDTSEGCPDVYTAKEYIDRAEAERMIAALLAVYGITRFTAKWKHPGGFLVYPVSI